MRKLMLLGLLLAGTGQATSMSEVRTATVCIPSTPTATLWQGEKSIEVETDTSYVNLIRTAGFKFPQTNCEWSVVVDTTIHSQTTNDEGEDVKGRVVVSVFVYSPLDEKDDRWTWTTYRYYPIGTSVRTLITQADSVINQAVISFLKDWKATHP